jgi:hypothetical protein
MVAGVERSVSTIADAFSDGAASEVGVSSFFSSISDIGASGAGSGGIDIGEGAGTLCAIGVDVSSVLGGGVEIGAVGMEASSPGGEEGAGSTAFAASSIFF